jgi:hypothetical protein
VDGFWVYGAALYFVTAPHYKFIQKKKKKKKNDGSAQASHAVVHIFILVERIVIPHDKDGRWEDGAGTVGRVRGWSPVCEDVGLEWIKLEDDQGVVRAARPVAVKLPL